MFPLNAWYVAATDNEIGRSLFSRRICNKPIVLYRKENGQVAALADACWHRLLPLSKGTLSGDNVICAYHGLEFDDTGRCVYMPSQDTINPSACVTQYPVLERYRFVWVWPGDPALADPAQVPDLHWHDDPNWVSDGRVIHAKCDYRLVVDNLMDLTHETFVHGSSIGNRAVAEAPFTVTHSDRTATVTRVMEDIAAPPFWAENLGQTEHVDRWQIINFQAPATVTIDVGVAPTGTGARDGDYSRGVRGMVLNTLTPETDKTCHYFWAFARAFRRDEQSLTARIVDGVTGIFHEDELILEAQQRAINDHPDHKFYNLNIDGGSMWARKLIDRMIASERAQPSLAAE